MLAARYWLVAFLCVAGMISLVECARAAESDSWGIASINDYIDKANVLVGDENGDFCSGTFISIKNRFVLTANHCVQDRVTREEKEFVDPITGEVTTKTIEKKLDLVVSKNIMKNYEVVSRQSFTAKIWARDPENDVAILQIIDPSYVPSYAATLAPDDYQLKRGETVYVVGNPGIQFDNSITKGIVSATERTLDFGDGKKIKVFQTDAVAIGGNSGGSVLNEKGEIVGTLDAGLRSGGITFVVPISATKALLKDKGYRDTEGPGVGAKPSSGQIDQKRSEIDYYSPVKLMSGGDGGTVLQHLDAPKTTQQSVIPACISPALFTAAMQAIAPDMWAPSLTAVEAIPTNGRLWGFYKAFPDYLWTITFKDGCATKLEVTRK